NDGAAKASSSAAPSGRSSSGPNQRSQEMTMHTNHEDKHSKDPAAMWRSALATFVSASVEALTAWIGHEYAEAAEEPRRHGTATVADGERLEAAANLLGVELTATVDEIRAAFRERVKREMRSGAFHDQGGDATDDQAQQL